MSTQAGLERVLVLSGVLSGVHSENFLGIRIPNTCSRTTAPVRQQPDDFTLLWPLGVALARWADCAGRPFWQDRSVLRLSSGVGLPSTVALHHGGNVTATDWKTLPLRLRRLLRLRSPGSSVSWLPSLDWETIPVTTPAPPSGPCMRSGKHLRSRSASRRIQDHM